ncbi:MAG: DUF1800 domain-containing protein [Caulobacterales bacterium]|nr:DUF1800 domain-containing protein [Caulobacterales bacterium]
MRRGALRWPGVLAAAFVLAACSGARVGGGSNSAPPTAAEAARFLSQTSYGATDEAISQVRASGYSQWIDQQMVMPQQTHLADLTALNKSSITATDVYGTVWRQAVTGPDQLRQRMKLALSEIFVISMTDSGVSEIGAGAYYDLLGAYAFANFRTLLEQVTLNPQMGNYLTWRANQKENPATGQHPDENFAREVMQLMTIGLYQLNLDGTVKTDPSGRPLPTYTADDISGLAKVFTGYSYYSPKPTVVTFGGGNLPSDAKFRAMIPYPQYHSTSAKSFLGVTIPATTTPDPAGDLKIALDTLFNHPNVGPFIGKQLIQRLVTSNPSPAYVARVAGVFNDNGKGVRGDMAAVVRAILLDPEARSSTLAADPNYGKLREPLVRLGHWARAFNATSDSGGWLIPSTSGNTSLGESFLTAPSVFNFYRPGYSPPTARLGGQALLAPEFQIVDEVTTAGYLNTMQTAIDQGIGTGKDVHSAYAAETALASDPNALADRMSLLLLNGQMSAGLRGRLVEAVGSISVPSSGSQATINTALLNRAKLAVFMTMASPEYLVQR